MRIAIVQNRPEFADREGNAARLVSLMEAEAADRPDAPPALYVLPELCCTGYQFRSREEAFALAESPNGGPALDILLSAARRLDAAIAVGFVERGEGGLYNSSILIGPDGPIGLYRKTHLFYREKTIFDPGDTGFRVFDWRGIRIGLAICFDWFFPESFRTLALRGADIIAHSANLVLPFCQRADFARAVENRVYVLTANRTGAEDRCGERLAFSGESVALSPTGEYLLRFPIADEARGSVDMDPELSRNKRLNAHNDLFADRRPEFYE
jgi:predicted amidohydrolase